MPEMCGSQPEQPGSLELACMPRVDETVHVHGDCQRPPARQPRHPARREAVMLSYAVPRRLVCPSDVSVVAVRNARLVQEIDYITDRVTPAHKRATHTTLS